MSKPVEAVLLGAGGRGYHALAPYAKQHPEALKIVAVAEPDDAKRARFAAEYDIPAERQYRSWEDLLAAGQLAPGLMNATMDRMHVPSTLAALDAGYHVLCEKPMAVSPHECVQLVRASERAGRVLQICHVLRYAPFWRAIKGVLESGRLGQLVQVQHTENVVYWHQAHSFIRGNWGNVECSAPMILAKCCHDLDLLVWLMDRPVVRLTSYGSLTHFRPEHAPDGAGLRCTDCAIEPTCPYSAVRLYLGEKTGWPVSAISVDSSLEARREAIETGPYGRCVWHCDNDAVDHQGILLEYADGAIVNFTMHGFSHENARTVRYGGSLADLQGHEVKHELALNDYLSGARKEVEIGAASGGHGGGDTGLVADFVETLRNPDREVLTGGRASLESHLLAFAAEESRASGQPIDMAEYRARIEREVAAAE